MRRDRTLPEMRGAKLVTAVVLAGALGGACGGDDDGAATGGSSGGPRTAATDTTLGTDSTTTTVAAIGQTFPESPVSTTLNQGYASAGELDPAALGGYGPGSIGASWYHADGVYVVTFTDLDPSAALCPGASLLTPAGEFELVTNSPMAEGACENFPTVAEPPVGVRVCNDDLVAYVTPIPSDAEGELYASVEIAVDHAVSMGITGSVATGAGTAPQVDLDALGCFPSF